MSAMKCIHILVVCGLAMGQSNQSALNYLCNRQALTSGAGYNNHPNDCSKYIQCHLDVRGNYIAEVRQCAFGTFWNMEKHTCLRSAETTCTTDECSNKYDGIKRFGSGNCRGYWECANGLSLPKCCPIGQYFNATYNDCFDNGVDFNCTDRCHDDLYIYNESTKAVSPDQIIPSDICDKKAVAGNVNVYAQHVQGFPQSFIRPCALGTEFVQQACNCIATSINRQHLPSMLPSLVATGTPWGPKFCKPTIYIPFSSGHNDVSGNNIQIINHNVTVQNGVAKFNGKDSRLTIDGFENMGITNTLMVKIKYSSNHAEIPPSVSRALLSNDNDFCHQKPSLIISENRDSVHSTLGTWAQFSISTDVPQAPMKPGQTTSEKEVTYILNNSQFVTTLGPSKAGAQAYGHFRNIQCPLHVGYANSLTPFKGDIDEIQIFVCIPPAV